MAVASAFLAFLLENVRERSAILRSEALTVRTPDVALTLNKLEQAGVQVQMNAEVVTEARRDIMPAWHDRRVPLSENDLSGVREYRAAVAEVTELLPHVYGVMRDANGAIVNLAVAPVDVITHAGEVVDAIDRWR